MVLFEGFDARQRPLFPADPLYSTAIVPSWEPEKPPETASGGVDVPSSELRESPTLAKCGPLEGDHLEFIGELWPGPLELGQ